MRSTFFFVLFLIQITSFAQTSTSIYGQTGLNRIGVFYEVGAANNFKAHRISLGLSIYAPSVIFEKNTPGFNLSYGYQMRADKKMKLKAEFGLNMFYENKGDAALLLIDPKLKFGPQWNLNKACDLTLLMGCGEVFNRTWTNYSSEEEVYLFLNYEIALRFTYRFRDANHP